MDNKAIVEKREALQKATQAGEAPNVIIGMLNDLRKGVVAKEETLRSTKIGAAVAKLKQHKNSDIARLASEVVRKWRDEIGNQRSNVNGKKPATHSAGTAPLATSQASGKIPPSTSVPPDQRTWKKDNIDIAHTSQSSRNNCIGLLYDGLVYLSTTPASNVLSVAVAVEQAIYNGFGPEDKDSYKSKVRSLFQNLKNKSNTQLRIDVVNGEIKPEVFVQMTHEQLKSAERREKDEKLEAENMRMAQVPQEEKAVSTSLQCSKCRQKKVAYSQAQTRSADEPMTTFCECLNCGKRWKFS